MTENKEKKPLGFWGWTLIVVGGLAVIGAFLPEIEETEEFTSSQADIYCSSLIKSKLNDPGSYRFESASILSTRGENNQYGEAIIQFRAKNAFGGYIRKRATCSAYENDGALWHKALIIE